MEGVSAAYFVYPLLPGLIDATPSSTISPVMEARRLSLPLDPGRGEPVGAARDVRCQRRVFAPSMDSRTIRSCSFGSFDMPRDLARGAVL
jgi:hypothetical protein